MADARFARHNERTANPVCSLVRSHSPPSTHSTFSSLPTLQNTAFKFISVLQGKKDTDIALELMRALAAQVKPICKKHGVGATSFEEHEWNPVFGGRNWAAGEVIEIVLRRPNGEFLPAKWLIHVMLHELTHNYHQNHGPGFQKMLRGLEIEMAELHRHGYRGDGFWSSGSRLNDGALRVMNRLIESPGDHGENLCGGAQQNKRPASSKRQRRSQGAPLVNGVASTSSGAQTAKMFRAGARNPHAFDQKSFGSRLDGQRILTAEEKKAFRKSLAEEKKEKRLEKRGHPRKRKAEIVGGKGGAVGGDGVDTKVLLGMTGKQARSKSAAAVRADAAQRRMEESKKRSPSSLKESAADELESEGEDSATDSDDDASRRPLPESTAQIRARLEEFRLNSGDTGSGKDAWSEFNDLTGDASDEDDDIARRDPKEKGEARDISTREGSQSTNSFSYQAIKLGTDSADEVFCEGVDPRRQINPTSLPQPIFKKPSPPFRSPDSSPSLPSPATLMPRSTPAPERPDIPVAPLRPSTMTDHGNGLSATFPALSPKPLVPPARPALAQPPTSAAAGWPSSTSAGPKLQARPAPGPASSSSSNPRPPPLPFRRPFAALAPSIAQLQEAAAQAFGIARPSIPPLLAQAQAQAEAPLAASVGMSSSVLAAVIREPFKPTVDADDVPHWNCSICTLENHPLLQACEACDTPRAPAPPPPRPQSPPRLFGRGRPPAPVPVFQAQQSLYFSYPSSSSSASNGNGAPEASTPVGGWTCWSCATRGNDIETWMCPNCLSIKKTS